MDHQEILSNDMLTFVPQNLNPDTKYTVTVTAIYPDESESEDLIGAERTRKLVVVMVVSVVPKVIIQSQLSFAAE